MSYAGRNTKDYSDDWDAFERGLKLKSTLDLTYYARNLISSACRVEGNDDFANALYDKLTRRASLVNAEISRRGVDRAPRTTMEERKRKCDELAAQLENLQPASPPPGPSTGARFDDPPIPTRITPLIPVPRTRTPSPPPVSLRTDERLEEEEDETTQPYTPPAYKKFKLGEQSFEGEDK